MKRTRRGFTLVELMVALVGGVIVAMAVVALARTATTTFYEQVRMTTVEASVRTASERLRNDLLRASFMSTPNIKYDPRIAAKAGEVNARYTSTKNLQGIFIKTGGSTDAVKSTDTPTSPDRIRIWGNLAGDDVYRGTFAAGGLTLTFTTLNDPATSRLVGNAADPLQAVKNMFAPNDTGTFIIRVVDKHRCQQFVELSADPVSAATKDGFTLKMAPDPVGRTILQHSDVAPVNCGANIADSDILVSPVSRVEWWLGKDDELSAANKAAVEAQSIPEEAGFKFNLYRQVFDASGTGVGKPVIVAEYAVDMKFGLVVHDLSKTGVDRQVTLDWDNHEDDIAKWAGNVDDETEAGKEGPQRIRSVRYRLATRSPIADRTTNVPVSATGYLSRYCVSTATGCGSYARVRTLISEVALINQERTFF